MNTLHYKLKTLKAKLKQLETIQLAINQFGMNFDRESDELSCLSNYTEALHLAKIF